MNFNEILLHCRFLDENEQPKGREYTYIYKFDHEIYRHDNTPPNFHLIGVPSYVMTVPEEKKLVVTGIFVSPSTVESFADKLKYVVRYKDSESNEEGEA